MSFGQFALRQYKIGYRVTSMLFDFAVVTLIIYGLAIETIVGAVPDMLMQFFRAAANQLALLMIAPVITAAIVAGAYALVMWILSPQAQRRIRLVSTEWQWEAQPPKARTNQ